LEPFGGVWYGSCVLRGPEDVIIGGNCATHPR
jgi:hypothetical protein